MSCNSLNDTSPISGGTGLSLVQSSLNTFQGYVTSYNSATGTIVIGNISNISGIFSAITNYTINMGGLYTGNEWAFSAYMRVTGAAAPGYYYMITLQSYIVRSSPNGYYADYNPNQYYATPNCSIGSGLGQAWAPFFTFTNEVIIPYTGMYSFQILCAPQFAGSPDNWTFVGLYTFVNGVQQGNMIEIIDYIATTAGGRNQMCWAQTLRFTAGDTVRVGNPYTASGTSPDITFSGSLVFRIT